MLLVCFDLNHAKEKRNITAIDGIGPHNTSTVLQAGHLSLSLSFVSSSDAWDLQVQFSQGPALVLNKNEFQRHCAIQYVT